MFGTDLSYTHISGNTYRITLIAYGDCKGASFRDLEGSVPTIEVLNGTTFVDSVLLVRQGPGVEITPVCAAQRSNTTCVNPANPIPGIARYIYSGTYTLPGVSAGWSFRFDGVMGWFSLGAAMAGRTQQITNVSGAAMTSTALVAKLNNLQGPNSSPTFTSLPTPFFCVNMAQQFNLGAVDPDGDTLSFALVPGLQSVTRRLTGGPTVTYNPGYSATYPMAVAPGGFSFSGTTGQMNFTANAIQTSMVVVEVQEIRNGVVVGTTMREMNFVILANCNTSSATNGIDTSQTTLYGGSMTGTHSIASCGVVDSLRFDIRTANAGSSNINVVVNGLPQGAVASVTGNNTPNPMVRFNWGKVPPKPGFYPFYVTYVVDDCPLASVYTTAYTIEILPPNAATMHISASTQCVRKAAVDFQFSGGFLPRRVEIRSGSTLIRSFSDHTGSYSDSLAAGNYQIHIASGRLGCETHLNVTVPDSGSYPRAPAGHTAYFCQHDVPYNLSADLDSGAVLHWFTAAGQPLGRAPMPRTDTAGLFFWLVSQRRHVCESARDTVRAYVTPRPVAAFALNPESICLTDTATLTFTGPVKPGQILEYQWQLDGGRAKPDTGAGPLRVHWPRQGMRYVTLTVSENRCSSFPARDSIRIRPVPFAAITAPERVCQESDAGIAFAGRYSPEMEFHWLFSGTATGGAIGPGPFSLQWADTGTQQIMLTIAQAGCLDSRTRTIQVDALPDARILNIPREVCMGERIMLEAVPRTGNRYSWSSSAATVSEAGTSTFAVALTQPTQFTLQVTSPHGCRDSSIQSWTQVAPCCNFSYPNAFTPNNDGLNDYFTVVAHGHQLRFQMSIYNRWGQRVYHGASVAPGWDGTYQGKPCDAGTYYYTVEATCYTGYEERHNGDVILVR